MVLAEVLSHTVVSHLVSILLAAAHCWGGRPASNSRCCALHLQVRVYHNNEGPSPAWFLQEVRVRPQGRATWTTFPCRRWLAVDQDDSRVLRELYSSSSSCTAAQPAPPAAAPALPLPAQPASSSTVPPSGLQHEKPRSPPAQRVVQPVWYSFVVCTSGAEGAGLRPAEGSLVFLTLHGSRGSSARVKLPSQAGDFDRGQEDVFRVQLPSVGCLQKLVVCLSSSSEQAAWLFEQVEVTEGSEVAVCLPAGRPRQLGQG